jgi:hypothetical protein
LKRQARRHALAANMAGQALELPRESTFPHPIAKDIASPHNISLWECVIFLPTLTKKEQYELAT